MADGSNANAKVLTPQGSAPSTVPEDAARASNPWCDPSRRILVVEPDPAHRTRLLRTLTNLAGEVVALGSVQGIDPSEFALATINYDSLAPADHEYLFGQLDRSNLSRTLFFSDGRSKSQLATLFSNRSIANLLARASAVDVDELIVTVQKILRTDIFGIEKYFIWGVETLTARVSSSTEKDSIVDMAECVATNAGAPRRLVEHFRAVTEEFLTNAIYNAPADSAGRHRFASLSRAETVNLDPGEEVEVKFCCDGRRLGVSTSDGFGTLSKERVLSYLSKGLRKEEDQVDDKPGGAGLGLYLSFESLSSLIINIAVGRRTEMIGLLDIRGSFKDFVQRPKSFNIFVY